MGLETLVARSAQHGVRRIELGMPHRGRLNVLCNILKKPPGALYGEMEGGQSEFHVGDVKYHLGQSASLEFAAEVSVAVHNSCANIWCFLSSRPSKYRLEPLSSLTCKLRVAMSPLLNVSHVHVNHLVVSDISENDEFMSWEMSHLSLTVQMLLKAACPPPVHLPSCSNSNSS